MSTKITKTPEDKVAKGQAVVTGRNKADYKAIKLIEDGKYYVEHKILADSLIKRKLAEEAKDVDFEMIEPHIKFVSNIDEN